MAESVQITVDRDTAWRIYDLLVHTAIDIENAETAAACGLGSNKFRKPANELRELLEVGEGG